MTSCRPGTTSCSGSAERRPGSLNHGSGPGRRPGGFTLLEAVVALAVVAVLAGAFVPLVLTSRETDRADATRHTLRLIKRGIVGGEARPGEAEADHGFVGDLGQLPDSLPQLLRPGGLPAFTVDRPSGLGVGWRGPYVPLALADDTARLTRDAFGRRIRYSTSDTSLSGISATALLQSAGRDGAFGTEDDIFAPITPGEVVTEVHGFLVSAKGRPLAQAPIGFVFRRDAALVDTVVNADSVGHAVVSGVPVGGAVVRAASGAGGQQTAFVRGSEFTAGNQFQDVGFSIVNVSDAPVTVSSITVTEIQPNTDDRCYREAFFDGEQKLPTGGGTTIRCEGETLDLANPVTLAPGSADPASVSRRSFTASGPVALAPEIRAGAISDGGTGTLEIVLGDWRTSGGTGPRADMRGIELTVQLSDGLVFTFTAPG